MPNIKNPPQRETDEPLKGDDEDVETEIDDDDDLDEEDDDDEVGVIAPDLSDREEPETNEHAGPM